MNAHVTLGEVSEAGITDVKFPAASASGGTINVLFLDTRADQCTVTMTYRKSIDVCIAVGGTPHVFRAADGDCTVTTSIKGEPWQQVTILAHHEESGQFVQYTTHTNRTALPKAIYHFPDDTGTHITIQIENVSMGLTVL